MLHLGFCKATAVATGEAEGRGAGRGVYGPGGKARWPKTWGEVELNQPNVDQRTLPGVWYVTKAKHRIK